MGYQSNDLIPPRAPPRRWNRLAMRAIFGLMLVAALFYWNKEEDTELSRALKEDMQITAMANRFYLVGQGWRQFDDKYVFSADLILFRSPLGRTIDLTPQLFRALCAEVLTEVSKMSDAPANRRDIFRLTLSFPIFQDGTNSGKLYGDRIYNIPVDDGACPGNAAMHEATYNTFPGLLKDWGMTGLNNFTSGHAKSPEAAVIFASRTGRIVPPLPFLQGCQAAVFDHEELFRNGDEQLDRLAVIFLGRHVKHIQSPVDEAGIVQNFSVLDGLCTPTSETYRLQ